MKFYKILFFFILFMVIFIPISKCDYEAVEIDISKIGENYNSNPYVTALANIGIKLSAVQTDDSITLKYNDSEMITYFYSDADRILFTSYPSLNSEHLDILNAVFVDTISTMQGNGSGVQITAALDDSFCFSTVKDNGVSKNYLSADDGSINVSFQVNPYLKLSVPQVDSAISKDDFYKSYESLYTKDDTLVTAEGLVCYKTYDESGNLVVYIGQPSELNEFAYDSVLNVLEILLTGDNDANGAKLAYYFKQNYSDFSVGNKEFDGASVDLNVDALPLSNADTVLVSNDMKFAKFTVSGSVVKEKLPDVTLPVVPENASVKAGKSKNYFVIIVPILVVLIALGIIYKVKKS